MSHSSEIRVLRVRPGQAPEQIQIPNTLSAFQQEVGGWIETVPLGDGAILICNEEGKLTGMDGNRRLGNDIIAGPFLVVGDDGNGDFCSLRDDQIRTWQKQFAQPELFQPDEIENSIHIEFHTM